jgi:membrane-associated phospholipid phosphatase
MRPIRRRSVLAFAAAALSSSIFIAIPASADEPTTTPAAPPGKLDRDVRRPLFWTDVVVAAGAGAAWIGLETQKATLANGPCTLCDTNGFDRSARDALRWEGSENVADGLSYGMFAVAGIGGLGLTLSAALDAGRPENLAEDELLVMESLTTAMLVNEAVKFSLPRERPFAHFHNADVPCAGGDCAAAERNDRNLSFFSGHTTMAFALATAAGTVTSMRHYPMAPFVWVEGMLSGTVMGYLRIAADRHYLSDVLTGAGVGAAFGFAVPFFHLRFAGDRASSMFRPSVVPLVAPSAGGATFGLAGGW